MRPILLVPPLRRHLELLRRWNDRVDLVAPATDEVWEDSHTRDSLLALDALPEDARRVVDVGSGAGFPGLVWALARPDLDVTLCESRSRRAAFLRTVARETGATNVQVAGVRAEALPPASFDAAVSRAVLPYAEWLPVGARLVRRPGGTVLAMLSEKDPDGWGGRAEDRAGLELAGVHEYTLPVALALRRVAILRRRDEG